MKAAFVTEHGPPAGLQVGELPDIESIGDDEVLINVTVSGVNPIDTYIRSGAVGGSISGSWVPGCDFAGQVAATGRNVCSCKEGDRVWGSNQGLGGNQGTLAEQVVTDQRWVYPIPNGVSDAAAAAGALTGITAHLGLHLHGQLRPGERVFVNGGTGGVGSAVLQLAAAAGAETVTTTGSDEKCELARELGADTSINYRTENVSDRLASVIAESGGFHLWYETLRTPDPEHTIPLMQKRGRLIVMAGRDARPVLPIGPTYVNDLRIIGFAMFNACADEQRVCAEALNELAMAGQYCPLIGCRFPLDDAAAAHQLQEDNTIHGAGTMSGKIVVEIAES